MRLVKIFLMLFVLMVFSACSCRSVPFVACETDYIDRKIEVKVPVACSTKDTFCDEEGSIREGTVEEFMRCVTDLRNATAMCKDKK